MQSALPAQVDPGRKTAERDVPAGRETALIELAQRLVRVMGVARALVGSGRRLDLTGIDDGVGMLCAQVLDLAPLEGLHLVPHLCEVRAQAEALCAALHAHEGGAR